jgi:hypothetical protein
MKLVFDTHGNEKQKQACRYWTDSITRDIVYGGSKGSGKSYLGISLIFGDAFLWSGTHYFIARKKLNDIRKYTIPSIHEIFQHWGITSNMWKFNGQDNYFQLYNGSRIYLIEAKYYPTDPNYYRFGSMQMTRGMIEEAGEFEESAKSNLAASIGRWKNDEFKLFPKLIQTCNPSKNYLYRDYYIKNKQGTLEEWKKFIQALPYDNKKLDSQYLDNLEKMLTHNEKERLLKGNWEYDDDPYAIFQYNEILGIFTNEFITPGIQKYITADIAYEGSDLFVIGYWEGMVLKEIIAIDKISEVLVSKKIHELRLKYEVPIHNVVYDADGLKRFVRQSAADGYLNGANEFHNGGSPIGINGDYENYFNLKAQCYFMLAKMVTENKIYISEKNYREQIIEELEQIRKMPLADDGKIRLEKKDSIRERLGRSPDFADMIMMRMWFELAHPTRRVKSRLIG